MPPRAKPDPKKKVANSRGKRNRDDEKGEKQGKQGALCNPQLRDPMTVAISFMRNPGPFRRSCRFTVECWNQAVYLEGTLPCPFVTQLTSLVKVGDTPKVDVNAIPILPHRLELLNPDKVKSRKYELHCTRLPFNPIMKFPETWGTAIQSVQFSHLPAVTRLRGGDKDDPDGGFLSYGSSVGHPRLTKASVTHRIAHLHIHSLPKLRVITKWMLNDARYVKHVVLADLLRLAEIEYGCMVQCEGLETVTVKNLPKLREIGGSFIGTGGDKLKQVTMADLPELTSIGDSAMTYCSSLESVSLVNAGRLTKIGNRWLSGTQHLKSLRLVNLPNLQTIGEKWLDPVNARIRRAPGLEVYLENVSRLDLEVHKEIKDLVIRQ